MKRLREYTSWVEELLPRSESLERDYLENVLSRFPTYHDRRDENAQLRARLAFAEEIVHVFFRRIITENFAYEPGRGHFDREPILGWAKPFTAPVAYALEHADAYGLTVADIRVGGRNSGHANIALK